MAYAPARVRPGLAALFALDERLGGIVATASDPTIGLLRLAWWRDALERLDSAAPPAEPLLRELAATVLPQGVSGASLAGLEAGWAALLDGDVEAGLLARHGDGRGATLFALAARLLDPGRKPATPLAAAGSGWALADLAHRHSAADVRAAAQAAAQAALAAAPRRWPVRLRPLGMLAVLAARDAQRPPPRAQGAPARVARMLAMRLTGR